MTEMDEFEKTVSQFKGRQFNIIEPGGDFGDTLIYLGLEKMLSRMKLNFRLFKRSEEYDLLLRILSPVINKHFDRLLNTNFVSRVGFYIGKRGVPTAFDEDSIILVEGGGNINDVCPHGFYLLKLLVDQNRHATIIVAPQSYYFKTTDFPAIFRMFKGEAYLFCREKYSYSHLADMKIPDNVKIKLSHDTAFYLSKDDFRKGSQNHDLLCFRTDKESVINEEDKRVVRKRVETPLETDISLKAKSFDEFTSAIINAKTVYTDRLHVGILAGILKKTVFLLPNSYWKIKGVYEYSLSRYDNVALVELPLNRQGKQNLRHIASQSSKSW